MSGTGERRLLTAAVVPDEVAVEDFSQRMRAAVATGIDPGITVADYLALIGNRWMRDIDVSSTGDPYRAGMFAAKLAASRTYVSGTP